MVYCSGSIGMSPDTKALVEGGVGDRTVKSPQKLQEKKDGERADV